MNIYIDTEFNGFNGKLISMALVAETGEEFYEVLACKAPVPWVKENVIPILGKKHITYKKFQEKLKKFLDQFWDITLIADWPEDIKLFCNALITGPGLRLNLSTPVITFKVDSRLSCCSSRMPHNALSDARALKEYARDI